MRISVESWDDQPTETPDQPTELEAIQATYPDIDPKDYPSWDDLSGFMWDRYGSQHVDMYAQAMPPYAAIDHASADIDHAATVLWINREPKES